MNNGSYIFLSLEVPLAQVPLKDVPCGLSLAQGMAITICGRQTPPGTCYLMLGYCRANAKLHKKQKFNFPHYKLTAGLHPSLCFRGLTLENMSVLPLPLYMRENHLKSSISLLPISQPRNGPLRTWQENPCKAGC